MIKIDMEMPTCCEECFALDDNGDYPFCLITQETRGYNFQTREKRMDNCPLIPCKEEYDNTIFHYHTINRHVYVVSFVIENNIEPTITVFDNKEDAQKMYEFIKDNSLISHIWLDECPLYNKYIIKG